MKSWAIVPVGLFLLGALLCQVESSPTGFPYLGRGGYQIEMVKSSDSWVPGYRWGPQYYYGPGYRWGPGYQRWAPGYQRWAPGYRWNGCGHRGRPCYKIMQERGSPYEFGLRYDDH